MTHASSPAIQVAGICGSLREGSFTRMALQVALAVAKEACARPPSLPKSPFPRPSPRGTSEVRPPPSCGTCPDRSLCATPCCGAFRRG